MVVGSLNRVARSAFLGLAAAAFLASCGGTTETSDGEPSVIGQDLGASTVSPNSSANSSEINSVRTTTARPITANTEAASGATYGLVKDYSLDRSTTTELEVTEATKPSETSQADSRPTRTTEQEETATSRNSNTTRRDNGTTSSTMSSAELLTEKFAFTASESKCVMGHISDQEANSVDNILWLSRSATPCIGRPSLRKAAAREGLQINDGEANCWFDQLQQSVDTGRYWHEDNLLFVADSCFGNMGKAQVLGDGATASQAACAWSYRMEIALKVQEGVSRDQFAQTDRGQRVISTIDNCFGRT